MSTEKKNRKQKQTLKIPNNIQAFYCKKKKIIIFKGSLKQTSLKINNLFTIHFTKQQINIIDDVKRKLSHNDKKKIQAIKLTTISLIKQLLIETTAIMYRKLKLVGVGYRAFPVENFESRLLLLRLGYSHPIYFKIPLQTNIFSLKLTKLFLYGSSYQQMTHTASKIRLNKVPEPYKGKGIQYDNETVSLKEGKKV